MNGNRKMNKGELTVRFLEFLGDVARTAGDIMAVFTAPYGSSLRGMEYHRAQEHRATAQREYVKSEQRAFSNLLYRLERDRLITTAGRGSSKIIKITAGGVKKLEVFHKRRAVFSVRRTYPVERETSLKIVIFDIPERDRWKRSWLRAVLKNLGFRMLQQSVWAGKAKVPRELLDDFKRLRLLPHVEIFAVTKSGSLKPIQ